MRILWVSWVCILLFATSSSGAGKNIVIRGGHQWGFPAVGAISKRFRQLNPKAADLFDCKKWSDWKNVQKFQAGECGILVHYSLDGAKKDKKGRLMKADGSELYLIGQAKVAVIVNQQNPTEKLTKAQIRKLFSLKGRGMKWTEKGGSKGEIKCYGQSKWGSMSSHVVRRTCMLSRKEYSGPFYCFREDFNVCGSAAEVIEKVRKDKNGIGLVLHEGKPIKGVKVLAIGKTGKGPFVMPKLEPVIQEDYPLAEPLILYLHPKAPPLAKKFCEFAVSEEGAKIAAEHGLITPWAQKHKVIQKRLREMKAGKGPKVRVVGAKGCEKLLDGLAVDYVMATAVIQMKYSGGEERAAVGRFATAGAKAAAGEKVSANSPQLLVLDGAMSEKTRDAYREKLAAAKPVRHVLGARGVAVIVNPKNPLKSITAEQVVEVFRGKAKSWADVAGAGQGGKTAGKKAASGKSGEKSKNSQKNKNSQIVRYSPDPTKDAAVKYFHREILQANRCRGVQYRKTADSVIGFVASNPGGIGVIDVNDLAKMAAQAGVKVLAIGPAGKAALPMPTNLLAGKYPLARQLIMYVSPNADEATKNFVKFILTAEPSETFAKAGLVTTHSKITMPKPKPVKKKPVKGKPGKGKKSDKKSDKNKNLPKWKKDKEKSKDPGGW
ncbi:MAG: substrate-binding domain-containing protein [Phycisphaerae bacterium]|nr:substrate-binding domain-containing protein [Phycisphaerae bacterium]